MLDLVIGLAAAVLVAVGLVIIAGPALPRAIRALGALSRQLADGLFERPPPVASPPTRDLHPTTMKAIAAAGELAALLKVEREDALASELRSAIKKFGSDESQGLLALHAAARRVRGIRLGDSSNQDRARQLGVRLRTAVADRAEQLELLPFR